MIKYLRANKTSFALFNSFSHPRLPSLIVQKHNMATAQSGSRPPANASHLDSSNSALKPINLLRGWPAPSLLPAEALKKASASVLSDPDIFTPALQYGADPGYQPLREQLAAWLSEFYGTDETADRIAVTGGASQSVACILQSYTDPSYTQAVWMVAPCYFLACPIFRDSGFNGRLRAVPEDNEGIDLEFLAREIAKLEKEAAAGSGSREGDKDSSTGAPRYKDPKPYRKIYRHIFYCVPSFSNPSGKTMSLARRRGLVELAREWDALVIADDVYDMLQWPLIPPEEKPGAGSDVVPHSAEHHPSRLITSILPRLVDIDTQLGRSRHDPPGQHFGHAVSNGSFSKLVGPGMRTGWVDATPDFTLGVSQTGSTRSGGAPSQFSAAVLSSLLASGDLSRHIEEALKPAYQRRHARITDAVARRLVPLGAEVRANSLEDADKDAERQQNIFGGYFIWIHFPDGPSTKLVSDRCREENLAIGAGALFEVQGDEDAVRLDTDIRLCFSWEDEEDLVEGVERLAKVVEAIQKGEHTTSKRKVPSDENEDADQFK